MARKASSGIYIPVRAGWEDFSADLYKVKAEAKRVGNEISAALGNSIDSKEASKGLRDLANNLTKAGRGFSTQSLQGSVQGLEVLAAKARISTERMQDLSAAMLRTSGAKATEKAFADLQRATGLNVFQMAALRAEMGDGAGAMKALAMAGVPVVGTVLAVGAAVLYAAKAAFDAALRMEQLQRAYTAIYGSAPQAAQQLAFLYDVSNRLGLQFQDAAEAAKSFFAASKGTALAGEARSIFEAFSGAGASLGLSGERMNLVFIALGQMISKGKVQTEELRRQLGESLPGAFQLAAKAMGVTTGELDKMLEQGQVVAADLLPKMAALLGREFTGGASEAQKAVNALSTEWERFKASASETDSIVWAINKISAALRNQANAQEEANLVSRMRSAGVIPEFQEKALFNLSGGPDTSGEYSVAQKEAFRGYSVVSPEDVGMVIRWRNEVGAATAAAEAMDRAVGSARQSADKFLTNSDAARIKKINDDADAAIAAQMAARDADVANAASYNARISAIEAERARLIKQTTKDNVAEANRASDALREVREQYLKLSGDESAVAKEQFGQQMEKWRRAIGQTTPEMLALADAAERAFSVGMTPSQFGSALDRFRQDALEISAQLDEYRARIGGGRMDSVEQARLKGLADIAKWKQSDAYKAASPGDRASAEADRLALNEAQSQQRIEEINAQFLSKAASTLTDRTDLQRRALDEELTLYSKHVTDKGLLDEWYEEQRLRLSRDASDGVKRGLRDYANEATNAAKNMESAVTTAATSMEDALAEFVTKGKVDFSSLVDSMLADIARLVARQNITGPLAAALGSFDLSSIFGGSSAASASRTASTVAFSGVASAKGNVFSGPGINAYSSSIVSRPTVFPFAKGVGLMGEAGAEAIMPLTRTSDGRLGVQAVGGDGASMPTMEITLVNQSGTQLKTKQVSQSYDNANRRMFVELLIDTLENSQSARSTVRGIR